MKIKRYKTYKLVGIDTNGKLHILTNNYNGYYYKEAIDTITRMLENHTRNVENWKIKEYTIFDIC